MKTLLTCRTSGESPIRSGDNIKMKDCGDDMLFAAEKVLREC